jgi:hypothetical protein
MILRKVLLITSLLGAGTLVSGTNACQENYEFAPRTTLEVTPTPTPDNDEDDSDPNPDDDDENGVATATPTPESTPTPLATRTPTNTPTPTATPTPPDRVGAVDLFKSLQSEAILRKNPRNSDSSRSANNETLPPKNKISPKANWLGEIADEEASSLGEDSSCEDSLTRLQQERGYPMNEDDDGDCLGNEFELDLGFDPLSEDSDNDGVSDSIAIEGRDLPLR